MKRRKQITILFLCLFAVMMLGSIITQALIFISLSLAIPFCLITYYRINKDRFEHQSERMHIENAYRMAETLNKVMDARCRAIASNGNFLAFQDGKAKFFGRVTALHEKPDFYQTPTQPPGNYSQLLPALVDSDRILIIGGMGTGKSTLLKHLISRSENPVMCDSHAYPEQWPCRTIGIGRDYAAIESEINSICYEMHRRYNMRAQGRTSFEPITLFIDELSILNMFSNLSEQFKSLLCECRKANIRLCFAGQSDRVKSLGIAGNGDLKQGFDAVCYLKNESGLYLGEIDGRRYIHPGPYQDAGNYDPDNKPYKPVHDAHETAFKPVFGGYLNEPSYRISDDPRDKKIIELYQDGVSLTQICKRVFGSKNVNSWGHVKAVLKI